MNKQLLKKTWWAWIISYMFACIFFNSAILKYKNLTVLKNGEWVIGTVVKEGHCHRKRQTTKYASILFNKKEYVVWFSCGKQLQKGDFVHLKYNYKSNMLVDPDSNPLFGLVIFIIIAILYLYAPFVISERIEKGQPIIR